MRFNDVASMSVCHHLDGMCPLGIFQEKVKREILYWKIDYIVIFMYKHANYQIEYACIMQIGFQEVRYVNINGHVFLGSHRLFK